MCYPWEGLLLPWAFALRDLYPIVGGSERHPVMAGTEATNVRTLQTSTLKVSLPQIQSDGRLRSHIFKDIHVRAQLGDGVLARLQRVEAETSHHPTTYNRLHR